MMKLNEPSVENDFELKLGSVRGHRMVLNRRAVWAGTPRVISVKYCAFIKSKEPKGWRGETNQKCATN